MQIPAAIRQFVMSRDCFTVHVLRFPSSQNIYQYPTPMWLPRAQNSSLLNHCPLLGSVLPAYCATTVAIGYVTVSANCCCDGEILDSTRYQRVLCVESSISSLFLTLQVLTCARLGVVHS